MADGLQSLIPSASPIASQGIDYDELLASGDPAGYMAAKRAGLEYKAPNVTLAPQPAAQSALAAGAGKPQESVAPAATPGPTMGTAASQLATGSGVHASDWTTANAIQYSRVSRMAERRRMKRHCSESARLVPRSGQWSRK